MSIKTTPEMNEKIVKLLRGGYRWDLYPNGEIDTVQYAAQRILDLEAEVVRLKKQAPDGHIVVMSTSYRDYLVTDRKSTRLNSSHIQKSRMPSSA